VSAVNSTPNFVKKQQITEEEKVTSFHLKWKAEETEIVVSGPNWNLGPMSNIFKGSFQLVFIKI